MEDSSTNLLDQVSTLHSRITAACELAHKNMKSSQTKMKKLYSKNAKQCCFKVGERVLVLLPILSHSLQV